jgi:hypothetical protein
VNRRALYAVLLISLGASAWLAFQPDDSKGRAAPVARDSLPRAAPLATTPGTSRTPRAAVAWPAPPKPRDATPWPIGSEAFAGWAGPPPPPAPPAPAATRAADATPTVPTAPPFPYQLIGRLEGDGQPIALLNGPLRTLSVKAQDTIDGQWRVEAVLPTGVSLLWLPGGQKQTVSFRPS